MPNLNRAILSITDLQALELFDFLVTLGFSAPTLQIEGIGQIPISEQTRATMRAARSITQVASANRNVHALYRRYARPRVDNPDAQQFDTSHDLLSFSVHPQGGNPLSAAEIYELLAKIDQQLDALGLRVGVAVDSPDGEIAERHWLSALQNAAAGQITRTDEFFASLVHKFDERIAAMEQQRQKQNDALELERNELHEKYRKEQEALDGQRRILRDADNTHERRSIRESISTEIQSRLIMLSFTKGTGLYSTLIHLGFVSISGVLCYLSITFANAYTTALASHDLKFDAALVTLTVKQTLSLVGLFAFVVAYIRWLNTVYQKRASSEFQLRQTQLDIERASWIVETLLEWRKAGQDPIPDQLMIAVTRGLFDSTTTHTDIEISAADQLASTLLGTASKLKINTGIAELEYDGKKLERLKKEAAT